MTEKREVIRRLRLGHSIRHINKTTGMHRTLIRRLKDLAQQNLWLDSEEPVPDEATIKTLLDPPASNSNAEHPLDPYRSDIAKWLKEEYSYVVIHQLLSPMVPVSESTVRRYCQKHFPQAPRGTHLRDTIPGEIMEVDFGQLGMMYDPLEKRSRRVYVFSARLRHSRMAYRQLVFSQKQEVFFMCHVHAFEFFGGVPERVVPDNLKAAVIKASFTDPVVNRVYHRLAEHYGFVIDPCLPYRPRLKGGVENDIKFIKGNFWPLYREHQRRVGNDIPSWEGAGRALEDWGEQVSRRVLSGVGRRPTDLFHHEEADCLKSLPDSRWKPVRWASAKVHETWRVQVGRAYYSVPYQYIGKTLQVYISGSQVEIYDQYTLVATHQKASRDWEAVVSREHNPPNVEAFLASTREGLLKSAGRIGPHVQAVIQHLLQRKVTDGLKPSRAILRLAKQVGQVRLDAACERALYYDNIEYGTVKRILNARLESTPLATAEQSSGNYCFQFSRPPGYFAPHTEQSQEAHA
jgi:transposase